MRLHFRRRGAPTAFEADPNLATLVRKLQRVDAVSVPALRFEPPQRDPGASLPVSRRLVPGRRSPVFAALGVALALAAGLGLAAGLTRDGSTPVSAASILEQAGQAAAAPQAATTGGFHKITRSVMDHGGRGTSVREWRQWGDGPDRWRVEVHTGSSTGSLALESVRTTDGTTMYTFEAATGKLATEPYDAATWRVYGSDGGLGGPTGDASLEAVIAAKRACFRPALAGKEKVAGREAYVIDLGPNTCVAPGTPSGSFNGQPVYLVRPTRLWIDMQTFSVVQETSAGGPGDRLRGTTSLVSYERWLELDEAVFVVDPAKPVR